MNQSINKSKWSYLWTGLLILTLILPFVLGVPGVKAAHEDYKHWADLPPNPGWQNGTLQSTNSQYSEGQVVPQYFHTDGLTIGNTYAFNIYYDHYDVSKNVCGFDHLSQYNIDRTTTFLGSTPTPDAAPTIPGQGSQVFYDVGANITSVTGPFVTVSGIQDYVTVVFTATATGADFYWGLHLSLDGAIGTCQGAGSWSGASLQTNVAATPAVAGATMVGGGGTLQINPAGVIVTFIAGTKYNDLSGDGARQPASESGLAGWTIQLYSCGNNSCTTGALVTTATTNATGDYQFGNLTDGNWYYVCEVPQANWARTQPSGSNCYPAFQVSTTTTFRDFGNRQGSITIIKDALPDDPQDFSFTGTGPSGYNFGGGFSLDDDADPTLPNQKTFYGLLPGTYTVTEGSSTWFLYDLTCTTGGSGDISTLTATIVLPVGGSVSCTFTNAKNPTAVNVKSFSAARAKNSILLSWETASETDNLGFNLYRASVLREPTLKLNASLIPAQPGSQFGAVYTYSDMELLSSGTYYYWLEYVDIHGAKHMVGPEMVKILAGKK